MKKLLLLTCLFLVPFCAAVSVDKVFFKSNVETLYYWNINTFELRDDNYHGIIPNDTVLAGELFSGRKIRVSFNNMSVRVRAADVKSIHANDYFPDNLIDNDQKKWCPLFYLEAVSKLDKNIIYENEKERFEKSKAPYSWGILKEEIPQKWHDYYMTEEGIAFYINGLSIYGHYFFIDTILKDENAYYVKIIGDTMYDDTYLPCGFISWMPNDGGDFFFTLIFKFDGDYLDVYFNDMSNLCMRLALVELGVYEVLYDLVTERRSYDLTQITSWPRRAGGSMDYPPPLDMSRYRATHRTLDNLSLRDAPDTGSLLVTTLEEGTDVQVIETGKTASIGSITAPWVKVISETGYTGWCFSGYLEGIETAGETPPPETSPELPAEPEPTADGNTPPVLLIAVIAGIVLLAGGAAAFLVLRKR